MTFLPVITPKKLAATLKRSGFFLDRQHGSHAIYKHPDGRRTVIPMHAKDLPPGTLKAILHDIDTSIEELKEQL